jgi:nitroimidazol reductase NimA-like FMN-containing flavoprotein (pyridoxamine 5'-phosphate oxidase superfamily)
LPDSYYLNLEKPGANCRNRRSTAPAPGYGKAIRNEDSYNWRSIIAHRTFEEVSNEEAQENVLTKLYSRAPHMTPVESRMVEGMKGIIVFRIKVEEAPGMADEW